jgi:hypothetical protein
MLVTEEAIERLRSILNQISLNSADVYSKTGAQIRDAKDKVLAKYRPIFSMDNLNNLTADDFKSFLLFKNNQHWDSLHRQSGWMTEDMNKLRSALKILMDESKPIEKRLNNLRPNSGEPKVKGLGRAVITAILQIMYPEKYGIWNNTAEAGMKDLKIFPEFDRRIAFGEKYKLVNTVLLEAAKKLDTDLWTLDMLWWRVMKTHIPRRYGLVDENLKFSSEEELDTESVEEKSSSETVFALEKYLHEFLVDNWDVTELSKEWCLPEEDGEIVGSKYYTGEVGEIDLLAKHKTENKWLVIELKRNQTSDSTVGQILRYISWVQRNLAAENDIVEGLVICHEIDKNLQYALYGQDNIKCMTYQVDFKLNPTPDLSQ